MKRFRFAQDRLLSVRRQQLRLAESQMATARANLDRAAASLRACERELNELTQRMAASAANDPLQWRQSLPALHARLRQAQQQVAQCAQELRQRREAWRRANTSVESLQVLHDRRRHEYQAECLADRQQEVELDVMRRWHGREQELKGSRNDQDISL